MFFFSTDAIFLVNHYALMCFSNISLSVIQEYSAVNVDCCGSFWLTVTVKRLLLNTFVG